MRPFGRPLYGSVWPYLKWDRGDATTRVRVSLYRSIARYQIPAVDGPSRPDLRTLRTAIENTLWSATS